MLISWNINSKEHALPELQKYFQDFKLLSPYYYCNYYPLTNTENMTEDDVWLDYQLIRPDKGDGIIVAFRRKDCPYESILVKLRGLNKTSDYELFDEDSDKKVIQKGEELINGLKLSLTEKPKSLLININR
jgi:alpha-galactosidase